MRAFNATDKCVFLSEIRYRDPTPSPNVYVWRFLRKRAAFEHEKEVRALVTDATYAGEPGLKVPICVHDLIDKIVISPYADGWIEPLIKTTVSRLGYKADDVVRSTGSGC
jgi:hypothetical protein